MLGTPPLIFGLAARDLSSPTRIQPTFPAVEVRGLNHGQPGKSQGLPSHCHKNFTGLSFILPFLVLTTLHKIPCFHLSASLDLQLDGWVPMQ